MLCAVTFTAQGQNIKDHYVARNDEKGTVYHTFPNKLFESREHGDLIFDVTYRDRTDGLATLNFTYEMVTMTPVDSVRFTSGRTQMRGVVEKLYIEPTKKTWKHRYTFKTPVVALYTFFDAAQQPEAVLYAGGKAYVYTVKPSAWRSYAPIGNKIFSMIRVNESH